VRRRRIGIMTYRAVLVTVVLLAAAAPAFAIDNGFYVGGGLGFPSWDVGDFNDEYSNLRFEDSSFGYKLFGGYRILEYLAVEAGYTNWGTVKTYETSVLRIDEELRVEIDGWDASVVGILPLSKKTDLFAKVGVSSWNAAVRVTVDDTRQSADPIVEDQSRDGTDLTFGAGLDFLFNKLGARLEMGWLRISDTDGQFMFCASLTYHF
jgi:OOP family OmpA-OmpF porin